MEVFSPQVSGTGYREKGTQVGRGEGQDAGGMGHGTQDGVAGEAEDAMGRWRVGHEMMQQGRDRGWGVGGMRCRRKRLQVEWDMG